MKEGWRGCVRDGPLIRRLGDEGRLEGLCGDGPLIRRLGDEGRLEGL